MKRIQSKAEAEKNKKRNQIILGVILVFLMLFSTAGYAIFNRSTDSNDNGLPAGSNPDTIIDYKGLDFKLDSSGYWTFRIGEQEFYTTHTPHETEKINVPFITMADLNQQTIYYNLDNETDEDVVQELYNNLYPYVIRFQEACIEGEECEENLPIKSCSDNLIIIREGLESSTVKIEDKCILINAGVGEVLKTIDAFIFRLLGIN